MRELSADPSSRWGTSRSAGTESQFHLPRGLSRAQPGLRRGRGGQGYYISDNPGNSGGCVAGQIDPISFSQGIWDLPPGQFQTGAG